MSEALRPIDRSVEKKQGFEIPKLSAPAAALLAALLATEAAAMPRADLSAEPANTNVVQVADRKPDLFEKLAGRFMQELKKRGAPEEVQETLGKALVIGADELRTQMGILNDALDAEIKRRGLDRQ